MNTMNLNAAGVLELNAAEMREIDGGGMLKFFLDTAIEVIENWDACVAAFKQGMNDGQK